MNIGVIVFPGTSGDEDSIKAVEQTIQQPVETVWHTANDLAKYDVIIIPGGATYGDFLRAGAIANQAEVMKAVKAQAAKGKLILGIGNGFQILLESGLLPGAMLRNASLKFRSQQTRLSVVNNRTAFTSDYEQSEHIQLPIAHGFGNYYCDEATLTKLRENQQIVFEYTGENPNGSTANIAGLCNEQGNVLGMMPHPERAIDALFGSADGKAIFTSMLKKWREQDGAAVIG